METIIKIFMEEDMQSVLSFIVGIYIWPIINRPRKIHVQKKKLSTICRKAIIILPEMTELFFGIAPVAVIFSFLRLCECHKKKHCSKIFSNIFTNYTMVHFLQLKYNFHLPVGRNSAHWSENF